ncbi:MAG: hypothetical protein NTW97_05900 [Candidatus Krumholzibacteria bacterium]|nr:hypothetical protein [Candidatus Krumholzibacteria bacterium]
MRNCFLFLMLAAIVVLSSCASQFVSKTVRCAYCKEPILDARYEIVPFIPGKYYDVIRRRPDEQYVVQNKNKDQALSSIEGDAERLMRSVVIVEDGDYFCSLRCVNAYHASQGIKEERKRLIIGE